VTKLPVVSVADDVAVVVVNVLTVGVKDELIDVDDVDVDCTAVETAARVVVSVVTKCRMLSIVSKNS